MTGAGQVERVFGALACAGGDVAPPVVGGCAQQVSDRVDDFAFEALGVHRVGPVHLGVAEVVEHEPEERR